MNNTKANRKTFEVPQVDGVVTYVLWKIEEPPDAQRLFVIIFKFVKQKVNFVIMTTSIDPELEPK